MRNTKDVAEFIRTMTIELTDLACGADLPDLGFILTLASLEAKHSLEPSAQNARRKPRPAGHRVPDEARRAHALRRHQGNSRKSPAR
jgi:hypothetical protein